MSACPFLICDECRSHVAEPELRQLFQPFPLEKLYHGYYKLCNFRCPACKGGPSLSTAGMAEPLPTFKQVSQIVFFDLTLRTFQTWHRIRDVSQIIEQHWAVFFGTKSKGQTPSHTISASITTSSHLFQRHARELPYWALRDMSHHFKEYLPDWKDKFKCHHRELQRARELKHAAPVHKSNGTWSPDRWECDGASPPSPVHNMAEDDSWLHRLAHFATVHARADREGSAEVEGSNESFGHEEFSDDPPSDGPPAKRPRSNASTDRSDSKSPEHCVRCDEVCLIDTLPDMPTPCSSSPVCCTQCGLAGAVAGLQGVLEVLHLAGVDLSEQQRHCLEVYFRQDLVNNEAAQNDLSPTS
eukprot:GGOE01000801.1.p1 GENE.GGOE01000801.1~~GGOE01000801.1.p1  ORF type:complete len:363 (-),score=71.37 GGOE01000801.1:80-1147(-)